MKPAALILTFTFFIIIGSFHAKTADAFDHSRFDQALKAYVNDRGLVDYNGISKDQRFKVYITSLKSANLDGAPRNDRLAFWLNAYNAITIDKLIQWKPKKSVRETRLPGVWTSTKFFTTREHVVAGRTLSQDDIEHEILRKKFKDPRIHFGIVCASSSCPPLPRFAYTKENVQTKLEAETRKYINSARGTKIDPRKNILYLSKLFDWFSADFEYKAGSVLDFLKPYLDSRTLAFLEKGPKIKYIAYNWAMNAQEPIE